MIRRIEAGDAEALCRLMENVDKSGFMMYKPGERSLDPDKMRKRLEDINRPESPSIFLAEELDGTLAGYMFLQGIEAERVSHRLYLVIGVDEAFRGQGVGTRLLEAMEEWARQRHIRRIELTVIADNERAVGLYKKMGFQTEGIKRDSLWIDGEFRDEYYMAKILQ